MEHDARSVANAFIQRGIDAKRPLTPLQVQKLVFFAHAWLLGLRGRPLINEPFEVWKYGPVVPVVYYCLRHYGGDPVTETLPAHPAKTEDEYEPAEEDIINQVFKIYGDLGGAQLITLTHLEDTPWDQARRRGDWFISDDVIKQYYADKAAKAHRDRQ